MCSKDIETDACIYQVKKEHLFSLKESNTFGSSFLKFIHPIKNILAQSAWVVEYIDFISAEGKTPPTSVLDMTVNYLTA